MRNHLSEDGSPSQRFHPDLFRANANRAGIFLDFDGTLSEILARPEMAEPLPQVPGLLRGLAGSYAVVAIVSGRTEEQVRNLLHVPEVSIFGLYGLGTRAFQPRSLSAVKEEVRRLVDAVSEARLEDKGASVAVHYRGARDPDETERVLRPSLERIAASHGLVIVEGKMVMELAPGEVPGKGSVVRAEVRRHVLRRCLYAGDDVADLDAFRALDELQGEGVETLKVAVASGEAPERLLSSANLVVDGPTGLVSLLGELL